MTSLEAARALALEKCSMLPATNTKRFIRSMAERARSDDPSGLTPLQSRYLEQLAWTFRRQMPADLVPEGKPQ